MGNLCSNSKKHQKPTKEQFIKNKYKKIKYTKDVQTNITIDSFSNLEETKSTDDLVFVEGRKTVLEHYSPIKNAYQNYILYFNFELKMNETSQLVFDWTEKNSLGKRINGIAIWQGSFEFDSYDNNLEFDDYRKLWIKQYNNKGDDYWSTVPYINLGEHKIGDNVNLTIIVNNLGVTAYHCDKNNKIICDSSGKNNGFIFKDLENRPELIVNYEVVNLEYIRLMTNDFVEKGGYASGSL